MNNLIQLLPKTELHLHIEGTLEPDLLLELSKKHKLKLPYQSIDEIHKAYNFEDLQSFLDLYYLGASVLVDEDDFYQLMWRYLLKCKEQNIVHTEMMFDPQTHTQRGIAFETFMSGFIRAIEDAKQQWGQSSLLIMSFLRHLSEQEAIDTLQSAIPYFEHIDAVGLDSSELGNPPEKFAQVFEQARTLGLPCVAHAGEEGPADYIWQALNLLKVDRIDHGVRSSDDPKLIQTLAELQMPLTVCPLSNTKLCVFDDMSEHNILELLEKDILVTVNSDDPSYFGGYLNENYLALHQALNLNQEQLITLVKNGFTGSFLSAQEKQQWVQEIDKLIQTRI
ncbi:MULTISPECIES: adenosine deaminase [Alteromonadaceae]|uniref:adenosine deaminase n=1 Tax=Alteromonadaceae TaxID=72275 RepID=UPI001C09BAB6|nr:MULTISPECIES: adenosine deaminase [Aliiglaciecola]MBU2876374.1 adenosine deaminase [Aliiglaciecola lipolytica]MDO6710590.1 adenosine deaminase [Aliiglaciecola sp. 2_MG-2023]MDO6751545.1 adenosine deaminase [Aliiglaciecola sp. 1_MG-2023]